jgi:ATP-dependent Lon protease
MELIEITGYLVEEKLEIARQHLLPNQLENHGVKPDQLQINKKVMEIVIEKYYEGIRREGT